MNFLQDVAKEIGNEYAGVVSDGVAAGDTSVSLILVVTSLMLWLVVQSMEVSQEIRLPLSQVSLHWQDFLLSWDCPTFS